jgi:hypothetical protein
MGRFTMGGGAPTADALRRALGALWIADALVKLTLPFGDRPGEQSYEQIMTAESAPAALERFFVWETHVFVSHPFLWLLPVGAELAVGTWLVLRPGSRRALAVSAGWALLVWAVGEALGGLASGGSLLADYPGAALLYAVAALVLFPRKEPREGAVAAAEAGLAGAWSRAVWLALWIGAALFTALPQTGTNSMPFMLSVNETEAPGALHALDAAEQRWLTVGNASTLSLAVAGVCLVIGFMIFLGWLPRLSLMLSILLVLAAWVATQNLGGILTGSSTDVGTGPVWLLLAVAFWPAARVSAPGRSGDPARTAGQDSPAAGTGTTARSGERP